MVAEKGKGKGRGEEERASERERERGILQVFSFPLSPLFFLCFRFYTLFSTIEGEEIYSGNGGGRRRSLYIAKEKREKGKENFSNLCCPLGFGACNSPFPLPPSRALVSCFPLRDLSTFCL